MNYYQPGTQPHLNGAVIAGIVVFYVVLIAFFAWMYVRIIRRAGYSGWWVLMALVPIGNLVMLIIFAFKQWPVLRELEYLRGYATYTGLPGYAPIPPDPGPGGPLPGGGSRPWDYPHPDQP